MPIRDEITTDWDWIDRVYACRRCGSDVWDCECWDLELCECGSGLHYMVCECWMDEIELGLSTRDSKQ